MTGYRVISSDDHVMEPPDLWISGVALRFRERAPHIVRLEDGSDWWVCDGRQLVHMGSGSQTGRRFEEPDKLSREDIFEPTFPIWLNIPLSKSSAFFKPLSICETLAVGMAIITP